MNHLSKLIKVFIAMGLGAAGALGALVQHESIKDLETDRNSICTAVSSRVYLLHGIMNCMGYFVMF